MERLVQPSDLEKYPELLTKGVSVNQMFDFDLLSAEPGVEELAPAEVKQIKKEVSKKKVAAPAKKSAPVKKAQPYKKAAPKVGKGKK